MSDETLGISSEGQDSKRTFSIDRVSQIGSPLAAFHELVGGYNRLPMVPYVFEHKMQHFFIHAP